MRDFVQRKKMSLKLQVRTVRLEYREQRDGRRGALVLGGLVLETGPTAKLKRRYDRLVQLQLKEQTQRPLHRVVPASRRRCSSRA